MAGLPKGHVKSEQNGGSQHDFFHWFPPRLLYDFNQLWTKQGGSNAMA
jgi:hypothetical protein